MKNNLKELNNYLFEELERLNDDDELQDDKKFARELARSKAVASVSNQIVQNAKVMLDAKKHSDSYGNKEDKMFSLDDETLIETKEDKKRNEFKEKLMFKLAEEK